LCNPRVITSLQLRILAAQGDRAGRTDRVNPRTFGLQAMRPVSWNHHFTMCRCQYGGRGILNCLKQPHGSLAWNRLHGLKRFHLPARLFERTTNCLSIWAPCPESRNLVILVAR
jgi:hypothetical protein